MKYIIKNRKFTALLILLTFIFTSILPTNIVGWNSRAEAAVGTVTYTKATNIENGKDYVIVYNNLHVLKRDNTGYAVASGVTIKDGKLTVPNQEQNDILWTITTGNNGKIVNKGNSDVKLSVDGSSLAFNGSRNLLVNENDTIRTNRANSNRYYLYYDSGWKVNTSSSNKDKFSFYYYDVLSDSTATVMDELLYDDDVFGTNDYPEYPNQGAVRIHKSATNSSNMTFNSTGVTKIELTATGVPIKKGVDVVVLLDVSSSMDQDGATRFVKAKAAAENFTNKIFADNDDGSKSNNRLALVTFAGYDGGYGETGAGNDMIFSLKNANAKESIISGIEALDQTYSGTDYTYPFEKANEIFAAAKKQATDAGKTYDREQYIVFLTDGAPSKYNDVLWKSGNTALITSEAKNNKLIGAETAKSNGVKLYAIGFDIDSSNGFSKDEAKNVLKKIASDEEHYLAVASSTDTGLTAAFDRIAEDIKKAGMNATVTDIIGDNFVLQMKQNFTVTQTIGGNKTIQLPAAPTIEVALYDLYTRADFENGVINDYNMIGVRKGTKTVVETITFDANGTRAYSSLKGASTNILVNNQIRAEKFTYDFATKTFTWNLGDITEKEASISYYAYMNGSMEGDRAIGSYATNKSAVLNYTNYLEHPATQIYEQPTKAWGGAAVHYEYYLVNANGQPVNSDGEVVPFADRVRYGEPETLTFKWNNGVSVDVALDTKDLELPEGYELHIKDSVYSVHAVSEGTGAHTLIETVPTSPTQLGAGTDGSSSYVYQYDEQRADTYVAFGIRVIGDTTTMIHKVDEAGQPIVGAQFTVKDAQGNNIPVTSAANGSDFTFETVYNKVYTITEAAAPTGYTGVNSFSVRLNSTTGKLEFVGETPNGVTLNTGNKDVIAILSLSLLFL